MSPSCEHVSACQHLLAAKRERDALEKRLTAMASDNAALKAQCDRLMAARLSRTPEVDPTDTPTTRKNRLNG
jgi:hypothetical protein